MCQHFKSFGLVFEIASFSILVLNSNHPSTVNEMVSIPMWNMSVKKQK